MGIKEYNQKKPQNQNQKNKQKNKKIPYKPKTNQPKKLNKTPHIHTPKKTKQKTPRTTSISHLRYNQ